MKLHSPSCFLLATLLLQSLAFQPASRQRFLKRQGNFNTPLKVSVLDEEEQAIDIQSEKIGSSSKESARLSKARQLLEQFTIEKEIETNGANGSNSTTVSNTVRSPALSSSLNSPSQNIQEEGPTVPDQYWSNGHLQGGNYVTRWAQGVKVAEPLIKYDPVAAEKLLFRQPAKWLVRNTQIAVPMGLWAAGVVTDYLSGNSKQNRRRRAKQLLNAISNLGPAIIKGGQALSSRPDLLPSEYLEELSNLQDNLPRFSNQVAFETVQEELNVVFEDVFELVEELPVAAASIGQVYKARLLSNGDTVALKIQRPKCEEIIALDLYILRWWSGMKGVRAFRGRVLLRG
jgi:hypothetical protein